MKRKIIIFIIIILIIIGAEIFFWQKERKDTIQTFKTISKLSNMEIKSPAFENNAMIPEKYACDGENVNPPLLFSGVSPAAKSLALVVDDPDARGGTFVHWLVWNIDPKISGVGENSIPEGAAEGRTDFGETGYRGPCPPSGAHRYFFRLYSLDQELNLAAGEERPTLEKAMQGHILAEAQLIGLYSRR